MVECAEEVGFFESHELGQCMVKHTAISVKCGICYAVEADSTVQFCNKECVGEMAIALNACICRCQTTVTVGFLVSGLPTTKASSAACSRCRLENSAARFQSKNRARIVPNN